MNYLIKNDEITLKAGANSKRNFNGISNNPVIEDENIDIEEINESKLFLNTSVKPRPFTLHDAGHKSINVTSYIKHIDMSQPLVFLAKKGCTCSFIASSTGL